LMSLLLDADEMKEMQEMGRYTSPRMGMTPCGADNTDDMDDMQDIGRFARPITNLTSPSDDINDDDDDDIVEKRQEVKSVTGPKATVTSPSGAANDDAVEKVQEIEQSALPKKTVISPSDGRNHEVDKKQEIGRFAWLKATVASHWSANNDGYMSTCGAANGDETKTDKEQKGISCAETNDKNESACISGVRQQVNASDDFLLCGAGDAPTSAPAGGDDEAVKKDADSSDGQWIGKVQKVVKKETKSDMPWLDTVSSSDSSGVEEKKEGSEVASAMKARCTTFASMLLIEEEEIAGLKKYSCW
jgi:hypothetical protein